MSPLADRSVSTIIPTSHFDYLGRTPLARSAAQIRRANQLDALAAALPMASADCHTEVLTDADGPSSSISPIPGWALICFAPSPLTPAASKRGAGPQPGSPLLACRTGTRSEVSRSSHVDPDQKAVNSADGMPDDVMEELRRRKILKVDGPHAPKIVSRRLSHWLTQYQRKGVGGCLTIQESGKPFVWRLKASARDPHRKSRKPVTRDVLDRLLCSCKDPKAVDLRDRASLLIAFAARGRSRSEIASLRHSQIRKVEPMKVRTKAPLSYHTPHPDNPWANKNDLCWGWCILFAAARAAEGPDQWMQHSGIVAWLIFREVLILKKRCQMVSLGSTDFSAHGLRSGFLRQAARNGILPG